MAAGKALGLEKVSITQLKEHLRGTGQSGAGLASRVSRLSKCRNGVAHPDAGLQDEILEQLERGGVVADHPAEAKLQGKAKFDLVDVIIDKVRANTQDSMPSSVSEIADRVKAKGHEEMERDLRRCAKANIQDGAGA